MTDTSTRLLLKSGKSARWRDRIGVIVRIPNLREVHLRDQSGELFVAPLRELEPVHRPIETPLPRPVSPEAAKKAEADAAFRLEAISPLLRLGPGRTRQDVERRARETGCGVTSLYRWIRQFEATGHLSGLTRKPREEKRPERFDSALEAIMRGVIERHYLTPRKIGLKAAYRLLVTEIDHANHNRAEGEVALPTPAFSTFRRRVLQTTSERTRTLKRHGENAARRLDEVAGHYPGATYPLAVVQIDHTPLDVGIVDSIHRRYLGRPWLTLVMDVYSRVVLGFHISLNAPSSFSVGMALTHAILPKDLFLNKHQESLERVLHNLTPRDMPELSWDCWGKPVKIKADNGREFWSDMLKEACTRYHIVQEFRPLLKPNYGGHIERLLGTVLGEVHSLPGTTSSNVRERGEYEAEKEASFTLEGLEVWLTAYILGVYHQREHSSLGMTPMQKWEEGILTDTEDAPATGIPAMIDGADAKRLRMDFLPDIKKTVQPRGVTWQGVTYMSPLLVPFIRRKAKGTGRSQEFTFRYDPNDISQLYFLDPDFDRYYPIRTRQPNFPSMSLWEYREAKAFAQAQKLQFDNTESIARAYRLMHQLVASEQVQTQKVQKDARKERLREERRRQHERQSQAMPEKVTLPKKAASPAPTDKARRLKPSLPLEIEPFEDIEF